ncbi:hypothetical protein N752_05905 [Desulforamulus aquiferis]|nr:ABC transporter substrate-binding protein [Desulforamulus aquiferis]RYD06060.1 hypothetical protein N752_05905 [Desulforamulus aquiferis]
MLKKIKFIKNNKFLTLMLISCISLLVLYISFLWNSNEQQQDIVIGVAWPFAKNNSMFREGVELAIHEINENGGVKGQKIKVVEKDDEGSVNQGMAIAQSFVNDCKTIAVIGHRESFISIPASRIYESGGIVMLSPASTAPQLTNNENKYIFRNIPSDDEIAKQLATYASQKGYKKTVIYYADNSYGLGLANAFEDHAKRLGISTVDRISIYSNLRELERLHKKWQALDFDSVFIAQPAKEGAEFIADTAKVGIAVAYIGGNAMDSPLLCSVGGKAAEGMVIGTIFNPQDSRQVVKDFVNKFNQNYNTIPSAYSAQGYDAVKLLVAAIEQAESTEPLVIAEKLRTIKDWPGVSGYHTFNEYGDDIGNLVIMKVVRNGVLEVVDESNGDE